MKKDIKVAIIGLGLIGMQRVGALVRIAESCNLSMEILAFDLDANKKSILKDIPCVRCVDSVERLYGDQLDWLFICTPHSIATEILMEDKFNVKNVFVEKPLGRSLHECELILDSNNHRESIAVGFNYRFYPGIRALLEDMDAKKFGKIISVNLILGHGNSPGMEKSWKLGLDSCGGGSLLDPGVHLLDLACLMSTGKLNVVGGRCWNGFWNTGIEEETHLLMVDEASTIFNMQVSLNRWRSNFRIEVNGDMGYGVVEGRGKSYGPQSYRVGSRWAWMGGKNQSDTETYLIKDYAEDNSFYEETKSLLIDWNRAEKYSKSKFGVCSAEQALEVMALLNDCQHYLSLPSYGS